MKASFTQELCGKTKFYSLTQPQAIPLSEP